MFDPSTAILVIIVQRIKTLFFKANKYSFSPTHSLKVQAELSEFIQTLSSV